MSTVLIERERETVPQLPAAPPTDVELALLGRPMPTDRLRGWLVTLVLTAIGGLTRFINLGHPTDKGTPVFDEKHYVPQAWQVLRNGGYEDNYGYELIVHPPLGKQLIAFGEWIFGYNGWGWRFSAAVAGTIIILLIIRIARRLTRSTLLGAVAGILVISDGVLFLQSRMGMLDIFLTLFVLAAFACLLRDRDQVRERLAEAVRQGWITDSALQGPSPRTPSRGTPPDPLHLGPRLGVRWWRLGAGVMLGLGLAVKWAAVWWVIAFLVMLLVLDWRARRTAGVERPLRGMLLRDLSPAVLALVVLAVVVHFAAWIPWFASETATDRNYLEIRGERDFFGFLPGWLNAVIPDKLATILPDAVSSLGHYQTNVLQFHAGLATPDGDPHPWESKPWTWPMGLRPMLYFWGNGDEAVGCGQEDCVAATMLIGTPAMWWIALPVLAWGFWRAVFCRDWRYGMIGAGYLAGLLPWFANLDRQMYFFYATPLAPFLVLGITLVLGELLGSAQAGYERRGTGLLIVALYLGIVVANFIWLWPILTGEAITNARWQAELWLPSWR